MSKPRRPRRAVDGILLLDKPQGITSNAALLQVRRLFAADKAGHTGSLDPMATGMLPICLGHATKICGHLLASRKAYRATVRLGARTDTGDADGQVIAESPLVEHGRAQVQGLLARSVGPQSQTPPMYSAIKQGGQRLYVLAREGQEVPREARDIVIESLTLVDWRPDQWTLDVVCSKGTYIRVLAEDLAARLGMLAHLVDLHRQWVAPFDAPVVALSELEHIASDGGYPALDALLLPTMAALKGWPTVAVGAEQAKHLRAGIPVVVAGAGRAGDEAAVIGDHGQALCLAVRGEDGRWWSRRWLARDDA